MTETYGGEQRTEHEAATGARLRPYQREFSNQGFLGVVKPYSVGDLENLSAHVQKLVQPYSQLEEVAMKVHTDYGVLHFGVQLAEYSKKSDGVWKGSTWQFQTRDGTLECIIYVGREEDYRLDSTSQPNNSMKARRIGRKILRTGGELFHSAGNVALARLLAQMLTPFYPPARWISRVGRVYGYAGAIRTMHNASQPSGYCTLHLKPSERGVSVGQLQKYRSLLQYLQSREADIIRSDSKLPPDRKAAPGSRQTK